MLQNGRPREVDFLADLGFALLPTPPAAGRASSPSDAPAGIESGGFAAHMQETPEAGPSEPAQPARSSDKARITGEERLDFDSGDLLALELQIPPIQADQSDSRAVRTSHPDGGPAPLDPDDIAFLMLSTSKGQAVEPGPAAAFECRRPLRDGAPAGAPVAEGAVASAVSRPLRDKPEAAIEPGAAASPAVVEGQANGPPESASPGAWGRLQDSESDRLISQGAPVPVLARPSSDASTAGANEGEPAAKRSSEPQITLPSVSTRSDEETPQVVPAPGSDLAPDAVQHLHQPSGAETVKGTTSGPSPPAAVAGAGLNASSEQSSPLPATEEAGPNIEPRSRHEGDGIAPALQERSPTQDARVGPEVVKTDHSAPKQLTADNQFGRPPQLASPHGNTSIIANAAIGVAAELSQPIARAPDGVVTVAAAGPHPATHQVALQITKGLDQDKTEIRIQLDPPELGEVDIHLKFHELRLTATVSADRPDTLDLLQRDARTLARALREAGIELADSDLSFTYSGRNDSQDAGPYAQRAMVLPHPLVVPTPLQDLSFALVRRDGFVSLSDGRMDLRV